MRNAHGLSGSHWSFARRRRDEQNSIEPGARDPSAMVVSAQLVFSQHRNAADRRTIRGPAPYVCKKEEIVHRPQSKKPAGQATHEQDSLYSGCDLDLIMTDCIVNSSSVRFKT
jgi:hypothetical protein